MSTENEISGIEEHFVSSSACLIWGFIQQIMFTLHLLFWTLEDEYVFSFLLDTKTSQDTFHKYFSSHLFALSFIYYFSPLETSLNYFISSSSSSSCLFISIIFYTSLLFFTFFVVTGNGRWDCWDCCSALVVKILEYSLVILLSIDNASAKASAWSISFLGLFSFPITSGCLQLHFYFQTFFSSMFFNSFYYTIFITLQPLFFFTNNKQLVSSEDLLTQKNLKH